jgi:hypothetical protein
VFADSASTSRIHVACQARKAIAIEKGHTGNTSIKTLCLKRLLNVATYFCRSLDVEVALLRRVTRQDEYAAPRQHQALLSALGSLICVCRNPSASRTLSTAAMIWFSLSLCLSPSLSLSGSLYLSCSLALKRLGVLDV